MESPAKWGHICLIKLIIDIYLRSQLKTYEEQLVLSTTVLARFQKYFIHFKCSDMFLFQSSASWAELTIGGSQAQGKAPELVKLDRTESML